MTPLLRELVAMPSLGYCSTRKTSCHRAETARAMAHPTTPPPIIRMLACSIGPFYPWKLSVRIDFIEKRFAFGQPRLRSVVHRINRVSLFLVMIAPQRSGPGHPIFIQRIKENMKRGKFFLVVVVIACDTPERFEARLLGRFSPPHHFDNSVPAGNLDVLFAFSSRPRCAHLIIHAAPRSNNRRIAHPPRDFPRQTGSCGGGGDVTFFIHRHARNRARRRMRDHALGIS